MPAGVAVARDLVGPATEAAINRLSPGVRRVAAYHYGLADAEGNPVRVGSGKALRPALALLSARAAGVSAERGVMVAVAVQRLITGQSEDLAFESRGDVTLPECIEMAGDKTAALMACACTIGAVHVGASPELAMGLAEFGGHVGLAFQLTDDLLGIWGATEVTGKPVMADLRARKKSLPVVAALTSGTPEALELKALLAREDELSEDDLTRAADLIVAAGGKAWAEKEADDRLAAAAASLDGIGVPADVRAEFIAIAEFITARQW